MLIHYIVHSTTIDNEKGLLSGRYDAKLSSIGIRQANELSSSLAKSFYDTSHMIFSSTLSRTNETAKIVFPNVNQIIQDKRLNEIDYGSYTRLNKSNIENNKNKYLYEGFPKGESYYDVEKRVRDFLETYKKEKIITIFSHQAPQLALEVICNNKSWLSAFDSDWRLSKIKLWKPYWKYIYS